MQKVVNLHAGPRGCNVARKATWLCHVDARASLRGKDVTWTHIIFNIYMGLPCIRRQIINTPKIAYLIYASSSILFLRVGLFSSTFFDCRTIVHRGALDEQRDESRA